MSQELLEKTPIQDLYIYHPRLIRDERGYFMESFNSRHFTELGLNGQFVQDNRSFSHQGTLRGLHLQLGESAQAKLVGVISGRVYDVAVDLRPNSPTRGQWFGLFLDAKEDPKFLYVPRGFAHGFQVLSETAEFYYKVDNFYDRSAEAGIRFDDAKLGITWPEVAGEPILSDKDKVLPTYDDFIKEFGGRV